MVLHELVGCGARDRDKLRAAGRGRILDVGRRMADRVEEAVDLVVAQGRAVLIGFQLGCEREIRQLPAHGAEQLLHRGARARAGIADIEALALEVLELRDAGFLAREHGERLRMHGINRAQVAVSLVLVLAFALDRVELHVRLRHAEVEFPCLNGIDVEGRAAGGFHRAADAVLGAILVQQTANRAADRVIDAGDAAGSDRDEFLLRCTGAGAGNQSQCGDRAEQAFAFEMVWQHCPLRSCDLGVSARSFD